MILRYLSNCYSSLSANTLLLALLSLPFFVLQPAAGMPLRCPRLSQLALCVVLDQLTLRELYCFCGAQCSPCGVTCKETSKYQTSYAESHWSVQYTTVTSAQLQCHCSQQGPIMGTETPMMDHKQLYGYHVCSFSVLEWLHSC